MLSLLSDDDLTLDGAQRLPAGEHRGDHVVQPGHRRGPATRPPAPSPCSRLVRAWPSSARRRDSRRPCRGARTRPTRCRRRWRPCRRARRMSPAVAPTERGKCRGWKWPSTASPTNTSLTLTSPSCWRSVTSGWSTLRAAALVVDGRHAQRVGAGRQAGRVISTPDAASFTFAFSKASATMRSPS